VQQLEQQLRSAQQQRQEAEIQLHYATEEAQELRAAKESAVVEKEQVAVHSERRSQAHEVRGAVWVVVFRVCVVWLRLRAAKESAVVEKEQVAVRSERRSQAHEVRCAGGGGRYVGYALNGAAKAVWCCYFCATKEAAVVEKQQVAVRSERRSQAHEVRCAGRRACSVWCCRLRATRVRATALPFCCLCSPAL
jgi:hypothetical protein